MVMRNATYVLGLILQPTSKPYDETSPTSRNPNNIHTIFHIHNHSGYRLIQQPIMKFLKPNKAVVVLNGRFAGRKAVIIKQFDDGTRDRPYGHCLVAGISKYPKKVIRKDSAKKTAKKSRVKAFIKLVNYNHIMPTRYTLDVDLKDVVTVDALQSRDKKVTACKETKARLEERFKTGKNRWFFSKLRF
ncbi:putative ribosomal protein L27e [Helianthus annuus]|nr:putative ribosomal protein L27e [Helianthus annuus]